MPFNGAGIFSRTPGTRIANQGALVSAQVNDETDNLVDGINGKVNLDGLLTYTGLHTLFGDGTAVLHQASVQQVQKQILGHATTVGGTVDAIQLTMTPASATLTNREKVRWTSAGANTVTGPTLSKDGGATNTTIKKGASAALAVGDLGAAGQVNEAVYNGTDWILTNASSGSSISLASTTEVLTGADTAKAVTPDALAALWEKGADIASATTISIGEGGTFDVTGTTTITDIDPATDKAGRPFRLVHEAAHILTHNASTMICITGADITTTAGDISTWQSEGSDVVRMVDYVRKNGDAVVGSKPHAPQVKTSGTTYTTPAGCTLILVEVIGGGGGGGNSSGTNSGQGGGAGGYARKLYTVTPSTGYTYAVGAAGAASGNGGNSTFTDGVTLITGSGGIQGEDSLTSLDLSITNIGGTGTNGDINISGDPGQNYISTSLGGLGGNSMYGRGGLGGSGVDGNAGSGYGAGGGGSNGSGKTGGVGTTGAVIITEYY